MRKPDQSSRAFRVAAFLPLETEHGHSLLRGVARYFRARPEVVVMKFSHTENYDLTALRRLRLDGVIAKVGQRRDERVFASLGVPVVNISGQIATPDLTTINTDDLRVGQMAFQHFHRRGYRNFAYCGSRTHLGSRLRLVAFRAEARRLAGTRVHTHFLPRGDQTSPYPERSRAALVHWLQTLPRPIGVFTFTDRVALEIEEASHRLRLSVPEQVAILGVGNDLSRLEFAHVELSSIQLNSEQIGSLAAERLETAMITGEKLAPRTLVAPMKIVTRRSTDLYAVADSVVSAALDHIRENLGNPIYVVDIARAVGVSRRALELRFRAALGVSVYEEAQRQQLEFSATLLSERSLPVGEVAYRSGFSGNAAFTRAFRKWTGTSPSKYRIGVTTELKSSHA